MRRRLLLARWHEGDPCVSRPVTPAMMAILLADVIDSAMPDDLPEALLRDAPGAADEAVE